VGKTYIASRLANHWFSMGIKVGVFKPAETGCGDDRPTDAMTLLAAANSGQTLAEVCPYRLREPLAPAVAAEREGVTIDFPKIYSELKSLNKTFEILLVEGAGGILVPFTEHMTYLDLVVAADLPVLIVAGNRLGCSNHALLTERACLTAGARPLGIILNNFLGTQTPDALSNQEVIERMARSPMFGTWPHNPIASPGRLENREREVAAAVLSALRMMEP